MKFYFEKANPHARFHNIATVAKTAATVSGVMAKVAERSHRSPGLSAVHRAVAIYIGTMIIALRSLSQRIFSLTKYFFASAMLRRKNESFVAFPYFVGYAGFLSTLTLLLNYPYLLASIS